MTRCLQPLALALAVATPLAQAPIDALRCRAVLDALDAALTRGDADGYLRAFHVEQPFLHALHGRQLKQRLAAGQRLVRGSEILGPPRRFGAHTVLTVCYTTRRADAPAGPPLQEAGLLVLREIDGRAVPTLAIELPAALPECGGGDVFACEACNYRIGGAPGWLLVPAAAARSGAVEACTFVLLGHDVVLEMSVRVAATAEPALDAVRGIGDELQRRLGNGTAAQPEPWLVPSLRGASLPGFSAARRVVDLPPAHRVVVHATALGALQHLLLLRGSTSALQHNQAAIEALLSSYELLQPDAALAAQAARALGAHSGGRLDAAGTYVNEHFDVRAAAPPGWQGQLRACGALFQVVFRSPCQHGRLCVTGYGPPPGLPGWTTEHVETWLQQLGKGSGLVLPPRHDSGFGPPDATGQRCRELEFAGSGPGAGTRFLRLLLRDDLLIAVDGAAAAHEEAMRAAMAAVGRR